MKEYKDFDAMGLAELVHKKQVSPRELLEAAISSVEEINPTINAVVLRMYEHAGATIDSGLPDGPLAGVPFLLKDIRASYAGVSTTSGSRFMSNNTSNHDSELVSRYKKAGLVIFGKTNTPEFACCPSTEGALFGATLNPWNLDLSAGGSSGGASAAVASRIVPAAHGSDGGGSIRIPASCCGVFGFKPSRGVMPCGPDLGEAWNGLSSEHALTISVRDSAVLLDVGGGRAVGDPYSGPSFGRSFLEQLSIPPTKLRIAVQREALNGAVVHPDCIKALDNAIELLKDLGHSVEEAVPEYDAAAVGAAYTVIIAANVQGTVDSYSDQIGREPTDEEIEPVIRFLAKIGHDRTAADLARAIWAMHKAGRDVGDFFLRYDMLLSPVTATPPPAIGTLDTNSSDVDSYLKAVFEFIPFTAISNQAGIPSMSVPLWWNENNIPIGVQLMSGYGRDDVLFSLAAQLEQARPWKDVKPPICV